jgi:hypothetical protein
MSKIYSPRTLHENDLCHSVFSIRAKYSLVAAVGRSQSYATRKNAYQRAILPNRLGKNPESDESFRCVRR